MFRLCSGFKTSGGAAIFAPVGNGLSQNGELLTMIRIR